MNKREKFIEDVEILIEQLSDEGKEFFEEFKANKKVSTGEVTEKGKVILKYMQDNITDNIFKSKDIGDAIGISGRSVSGSIKKLITDGYVEKVGTNPVTYAITEAGKDYKID